MDKFNYFVRKEKFLKCLRKNYLFKFVSKSSECFEKDYEVRVNDKLKNDHFVTVPIESLGVNQTPRILKHPMTFYDRYA